MRRITYVLMALSLVIVTNAQSITKTTGTLSTNSRFTVNGTVDVTSTAFSSMVSQIADGDTLLIGSASDSIVISTDNDDLKNVDITLMIVDGGTAHWGNVADWTLSDSTILVMFNGGDLSSPLPCNANKRLIFGPVNVASCSGGNADYSFSDILSFGGWDPANPPLPVGLTYFKGEKLEPGLALLKWQTIAEYNHQKFEILKSEDGVNFTLARTIYGDGINRNSMKNYEIYDDYNAAIGVYYKLVQTDFDGSSETFNVVYIAPEKGTIVTAYPNPTVDQLHVAIKSENLSTAINIISASGQIVYHNTVDSDQTHTIDMRGMSKGAYFLVVDGEKFTILKK